MVMSFTILKAVEYFFEVAFRFEPNDLLDGLTILKDKHGGDSGDVVLSS